MAAGSGGRKGSRLERARAGERQLGAGSMELVSDGGGGARARWASRARARVPIRRECGAVQLAGRQVQEQGLGRQAGSSGACRAARLAWGSVHRIALAPLGCKDDPGPPRSTLSTHIANRNFLAALSSATATACTPTQLLSATAATSSPQSVTPTAFHPSRTSKMTPILPQTKCGITKRALYHPPPVRTGPL